MKIPRIVKSPKRLFRIFVILFLLVILSLLSICIYDCILDDSGVARKLHLDMWDWFALLVAAISLLFTVLTWWSQDQTRENTTRFSTVDYRDMLVSCYYNIVRNTINLYSLSECLKDRYTGYYPSEEYLQKLKLYLFEDRQEDYEATLKALNAAINRHLGNRPEDIRESALYQSGNCILCSA